MGEFNYEQQLTAAKEAAKGLKQRLEDKILGQILPPLKCDCGATSHGCAEAIEVVPAGSQKRYEGQITHWFIWTVKMRELKQSEGYAYSCGLSKFLPVDEIESMFSEAFKGIDGDTLERQCYARNPKEIKKLLPYIGELVSNENIVEKIYKAYQLN